MICYRGAMLNRCRSLSRTAFAGLLACSWPRAAARGRTRRCRGRRRWCPSPRSRRATFRSRCARPSICGRWCKRTSGRRRSATWTPSWSIGATGSRGASCWRWSDPSDLPDQLAAARSSLAQAQSSAALARTNYDRAKQLAPEAVVSQQELQQAQSQFATAEAAQQAAPVADRRAGGAPGRDAHRVAADGRRGAAPPRSGRRWSARRAAARS